MLARPRICLQGVGRGDREQSWHAGGATALDIGRQRAGASIVGLGEPSFVFSNTPESLTIVKNLLYAIVALDLMLDTAPAMAQTVTSAVPYGQISALPPATTAPAQPADPNAPRWMLLEGYGRHGEIREHWQLVRPQDFDVSNYHGFHTATD